MTALICPDDDELHLLALLLDESGVDLAEFCFYDAESLDGCYRVWDYQWRMYLDKSPLQVERGARSVGKTAGVVLRAAAFPFSFGGQKMLLAAPQKVHLQPLYNAIQARYLSTRILKEMLPGNQTKGVRKDPSWEMHCKNNAEIVSRIEGENGKGFKGQHVLRIELDECFPAGTLITTRRGQVPIERVGVGDQVLTHKNRWKKVTDTFQRTREVVRVEGQGHPGLVCSTNHKFFAMREEERLIWNGRGTAVTPSRTFDRPEFIAAKDLQGHRWSSPTTFPKCQYARIPSLRGVGDHIPGWRADVDLTDPLTFWMVGLYLAEGSVGSAKGADAALTRLTFSIHQDEVPFVRNQLAKIGLDPSGPYPVKDTLGVNLVLYSKVRQLAPWLVKHFGRGHDCKEVASWALGLPRESRAQLLDGLIYGDGCWIDGNGLSSDCMKLTTASKKLAVSARLLGLSLGYSVSVHWCDLSERTVLIRGREIKSNGFYQVVFREAGNAVMFKNRSFIPVWKVVSLGRTELLYDLTVEDDHTFIADGLIVSNSQDLSSGGWTELGPTLNRHLPGYTWRAHGVPRGIRDKFYEITDGTSSDGEESWMVHKPVAMNRPNWNSHERSENIKQFGGSRQSTDYKRNLYGEHGDSTSAVFVAAKLLSVTDTDETSIYNTEVYKRIQILVEDLPKDADHRAVMIQDLISAPDTHFQGWSQKVKREEEGVKSVKEVGATKGYDSYWAGLDVGLTSHPSELMVCGQRAGVEHLDLLLRVHMQRINVEDQMHVVDLVFDIYGLKLRGFGIDSTGMGEPLRQMLAARKYGKRVHGFNFSSSVIVGFDDGEEPLKDRVIKRNFIEASTDWLRNNYVHAQNMRLPFDREVLLEMQAQTYTSGPKTSVNPYGTKRYAGGSSYHTLDSLKCLMGAKFIPPLEAMLVDPEEEHDSILDWSPGWE